MPVLHSCKEWNFKQNDDEKLSESLVGDNQVIRVVGRPSLVSHKSRPGRVAEWLDSWIVGKYC